MHRRQRAQLIGPVPDRFETLRQNSVTSLDATGSSLWIGPGLNRIDEGSPDIFIPESRPIVYSTDAAAYFHSRLRKTEFLPGLGLIPTEVMRAFKQAMGFYESENNGQPGGLSLSARSSACGNSETAARHHRSALRVILSLPMAARPTFKPASRYPSNHRHSR